MDFEWLTFEPKYSNMKKLAVNNDNELLSLISRGDEVALAQLYHRYYEMLLRTAGKRLQDTSVAEEIVQDVFINLWDKASTLDPEGNIRSYLFATLRNKVLHEIRATIVLAKHAVQLVQEEQSYNADSFEIFHAKCLEQKIHTVVNDLPPQCREAFKLSRLENLSYKLIAERMNISVNTVEKHIGKALIVLRKSLKEFDVTLPLIMVLWLL